MARILHCCGCGVGWKLELQFDPSLGTSICHRCSPKKQKEKRKKSALRVLALKHEMNQSYERLQRLLAFEIPISFAKFPPVLWTFLQNHFFASFYKFLYRVW